MGAHFLNASLDEMSLSEPHQCYFVSDLRDVNRGDLLSKAFLFSWRYLVLRGEKAIGEVELNADANAGPLVEFKGISKSILPDATLVAVSEAKKLPQLKEKRYQLRLLKVPALNFVAVWLQRDEEDILIPLHSFAPELKVNSAYSEAQVIAILKPMAGETLEKFKKAGPNAVGQ